MTKKNDKGTKKPGRVGIRPGGASLKRKQKKTKRT